MRKHLRAGAVLPVFLGMTAGLSPAAQAGTVLLCERPEVLRIFDRTVREWNIYNRVVEGSVREAPTPVANAVTCDVTVSTVGYVPTPAGWAPRTAYETRRFAVQVTGRRVLVRPAQ